jgi:hypothetical protein
LETKDFAMTFADLSPDGARLETFLNLMIRQGKMVIALYLLKKQHS